MNKIKRITEPTWIIHRITKDGEYCEECGGRCTCGNADYNRHNHIRNTHTHGLNKYGLNELCFVLDFDTEVTCTLINYIGLEMVNHEVELKEGVIKGLLENDYDIYVHKFVDEDTFFVFLPDKNNKFPIINTDCEYPFSEQYKYAYEIHSQNVADGLEGVH